MDFDEKILYPHIYINQNRKLNWKSTDVYVEQIPSYGEKGRGMIKISLPGVALS